MITGTFNGFNVVALPTAPGLRTVEFAATDSVAVVTSPFSLASQYYQWAGADLWTGTATLPEMTQAQAAPWVACLMELRGKLNCFLIGDPTRPVPNGNALTSGSTPTVDGTVSGGNLPGSTTLYTAGWAVSHSGLLLPGDYLQVGYRLYTVLDQVDSDSSGKAGITIWPSVRETPSGGAAITLSNTAGLFRLADNKRQWSADYTRMTQLSFQFAEVR